MSKYIVSLTPLGKYFFGGDMTFKVSDKNDYNERYSSYVIQSGQFPQQTSLLGMMRFLLLSNSSEAFDTINLKIISTEKAREIIGAQGFVITKDYASNNFEKIKNISPCFLEMSVNEGVWTTLLPAPKDYGYNVSFTPAIKVSFNGKQGDAPILTGYDPKEWKEDLYIGNNRLGNYKQKRKFRFAFEVEVDDSINLTAPPYQHSIVNIGGDSSQFIFEARKATEEQSIFYPESYNNKKEFASEYKVVLLSDSYLKRQEVEKIQYAITNIVPFRFIQTTVETTDYTILSPKNLRSNKYYLYQKGSVFFCTSEQLLSLKETLEKPCFKQIGYNHYQIIKR